MTDPADPDRPDGAPTAPDGPAPGLDLEAAGPIATSPAPPTDPPALRPFSLDGRRVPGLYLVGWLATVLGGPLLGAAFVSGVGGIGGLVLTVGGSVLLGLGLIAAAGSQAIERRDRADLPYRGPSPFLVFGASVPLSIVITLPLILVRLDLDSPTATVLSVVATGAIWIGLIGLTVVGPGALHWRDILVGLADAPLVRVVADLGFGALAALPVIALTTVVGAIVVALVGVTPQGPIVIPPDGPGLALSLVAAAVIAPVTEEVFYRGFATTAWARTIGPVAAVVRGGLFFALVHILTISGPDFDHAAQAALVAFLVRIPIALALGWVFIRRRSIAASIGLHAAFNAVLVLAAAAAR